MSESFSDATASVVYRQEFDLSEQSWRRIFTAAALASIVSNAAYLTHIDNFVGKTIPDATTADGRRVIVETAVGFADAALAELAKPKPKGVDDDG